MSRSRPLETAPGTCGDGAVLPGKPGLEVCGGGGGQAHPGLQNGQLSGLLDAASTLADAGDEWVDETLRRISASESRSLLSDDLVALLEQALAADAGAPDAAGLEGHVPNGHSEGQPGHGQAALERARSEAATELGVPAGTDGRGELANGLPADPAGGATAGEAPPAAPPVPPAPSAHYVHKRGENFDPDVPEEYRDDSDPGYRIREVSEAELLSLVQEKYCTSWPAVGGSSQPTPTAPPAMPEAPLAVYPVEVAPPTAGAAAPAAVAAQAQASQMSLPYPLASKRKERRPGRPAARYPESGDPFYPVELDGVVYDSFSLRVVYERDRTGFEESKEFPIRINSIVAARYQVLEYLGSAAFSRAVQCLDLQTNRMVCMKIIKNDKDFFDQSLDEIKLLKIINANCANVDEKHCLALIDYFYHKEHLIIVTELLRDNLYEFSKFNRECGEEPYFTLGRLQRITKQVLVALEYIHSLWLIHADLKPENILVKSYSRCEVKVIDFGSSCFVDDQLTSYVQSRSYRAPEVMLGLPYNQKVDLWSLGCIIAELWTGYVLFQNDSVQSLLARIVGIVGPFPPHMMSAGRFSPQYFTQDAHLYRESEAAAAGGPGSPVVPERRLHLYLPKKSSLRQRMRTDDELFISFLTELLRVDPALRPASAQALKHPWLAPGRYPDGL